MLGQLASTGAEVADKEGQIASLGLRSVLFSALILVVLIVIASQVKDKYKKLKLPLFVLIASSILVPTLILFGTTVYLNVISESKGPVHWHTGIEFWVCDAEIDLRNPQGALSNKIGTSTYHEHNDKFIHLEGVVLKKAEDASLEKFMRVTGGYINDSGIGIPLSENESDWFASEENDKIDGDTQKPENFSLATGAGEWVVGDTNKKVLELKNGNNCSGGDESPAEVQVFVYHYNEENKTYTQSKLEDPKSYTMREKSLLGPPSDCVIVEYDVVKERTNKLCQQYGVKDATRCTEFGVTNYNPDLCYIKEVTTGATPEGGEL